MPYLKYSERDIACMLAVVAYHAELPRVSDGANRAVITLNDLFKNELSRLRGIDLDIVIRFGKSGLSTLELLSKKAFGQDGAARVQKMAKEMIPRLISKYGKEGELWQSC